jgi:hypothetical protein
MKCCLGAKQTIASVSKYFELAWSNYVFSCVNWYVISVSTHEPFSGDLAPQWSLFPMAAHLYNDFMFLWRFGYMYPMSPPLTLLIFVVTIFHFCCHYLTGASQICWQDFVSPWQRTSIGLVFIKRCGRGLDKMLKHSTTHTWHSQTRQASITKTIDD